MRKIFRSRRSVITLAAVVLLAVWSLWYARPLSVRDLMGGANPETAHALIVNAELQSDFKWKTETGTFVCDEGPVMDELFSQLDGLRFHRNPLEVVLQFLPRDGGEITGKSFNLYAYDQSGKEILELYFSGEHWRHQDRLPLYTSHNEEEAGKSLGAWLWENRDKN